MTNSKESKRSKKRSEGLNRKGREFPMFSCSVRKKKFLKMNFTHGT